MTVIITGFLVSMPMVPMQQVDMQPTGLAIGWRVVRHFVDVRHRHCS